MNLTNHKMVENKIKKGTEEYSIATKKLEETLKEMKVQNFKLFSHYLNNFVLISSNMEDFSIEILNSQNYKKDILNHYLQGEITLEETRKYWKNRLF